MEEDPQGSTQATPASLDTKEDQATEGRPTRKGLGASRARVTTAALTVTPAPPSTRWGTWSLPWRLLPRLSGAPAVRGEDQRALDEEEQAARERVRATAQSRAPQDPRMAGATPATPAIQDSNGTQGTQATTPDTLQDILDTPRNREVQGQGLAFHLRQQEAPSRHRAPRKRRAATTVGLSLARKGRGLPRRGRVQAHVQGPHLHPQDLPHRDPCPQPSPSPGREEQSQCLHDRQAVQAKATVQA